MNPARKSAFLSRLAQDTAGNTLAIMAAAFFPLAGLIGGGVDMTRIYITKTRLQQACDAGALSGRKAMGSGAWSTAAGGSRAQAYQLFASNFSSGDFGTEALTREFTESDGTVTGTASADVPMTLMQIFGQETRTISVTCTAKMEIPNTDVMFVLDVTLSMMCAPSDGALGCNTGVAAANKRITGLRKAVKCFYEALLKANTSEVCGNDPTATAYTGTAQVRLGFVPYASNVNVGRLLPHSAIADSWQYQTRVANTETAWGWTLGTEDAVSNWSSWSAVPEIRIDNVNDYGTFSVIGGGNDTEVTFADGSKAKKKNTTVSTSGNCLGLNTLGNANILVGIQETYASPNAATYSPTDNDPPNHAQGDSEQPLDASQTRQATITTGYKYRWHKNGTATDACWLESAAKTTGSNAHRYNQTRTGTSSRDIIWTEYPDRFLSWTYKAANLTVSGLKTGTNAWNTSVALPLALSPNNSVRLSGQSGTTDIQQVINTNVDWNGCILERPTYQNTDGNPDGEFDPIPDTAKDLDIDLMPSSGTAGSQWGPMLPNAVWGRYTGSNSNSNWTTSNVTTSTDFTDRNRAVWCPNESRKLREYATAGDTDNFVSYIDSFVAEGQGTYHDIGMLWGARLLSPTGIFGDENAMTDEGGAIERHLIFMTDGSTQTVAENLYAYGMPWWDRRQTSYAPGTDGSGQQHLDLLVNERLEALCTRIKNMNIQLWVISYGAGVNAANKTRLETCASPGRFYDAADSATLLSRFQQIASEIADLRLTQ